MPFIKHLKNKLSQNLWGKSHREPNARDFINTSKSINVSVISINPGNYSSTSLSSSSSLPELSTFAQRKSAKTGGGGGDIVPGTFPNEIETFTFTNNVNSLDQEHNNNCRLHSSTNSDGEIIPAFTNLSLPNNFLPHNSSKQGTKKESSSLCQVEPVILSLTPLSKSAQKEYFWKDKTRNGDITHVSHSSRRRRTSSAPHNPNAKLRWGEVDNGLHSLGKNYNRVGKGSLDSSSSEDKDEFLQDAINVSNCEKAGRNHLTGVNINIRCCSSACLDYRDSHHPRLKKNLSFGVDDLLPLPQPLGKGKENRKEEELLSSSYLKRKGIEKESEDKTDEHRADNNSTAAAETNNEISKSRNSNFLATTGAQNTQEKQKEKYQQQQKQRQQQQFPSFFGRSEVDGRKSERRRRSIPTSSVYSTAGSHIWDKLLDDNRTRNRQIHSSIGVREKYEEKSLRVDSTGTQTHNQEGKVALHGYEDIGRKFSCREPKPNTTLSKSAEVEAAAALEGKLDPDLVAVANLVKGLREVDCLVAAADPVVAGAGRTTRDQPQPRSSSRITTFTRDRPSSSSSCGSFSSILSDSSLDDLVSAYSLKSAGSGSELGRILIVATEEGGDSSTPVVAPLSISTSSETSKVLLPSGFCGGSVFAEGLSCSHKVNQRKRSIYYGGGSNNSNANSSSSKSDTAKNSGIKSPASLSKPGREERKRFIIQCLLCTKGFNLVVNPKQLFARLFLCGSRSSRKHPIRVKAKGKKLGEGSSRRVQPSLSFSPSYSSSSSSRNKSKRRRRRLVSRRGDHLDPESDKPLKKAHRKLWATMDHEDLIRELPQIEKLSNQERLRLAHKRRMLQLKKFSQYEKDLNSNSKKHRGESDLIRRNLPSKHNIHPAPPGRKGSRRIRFRNSIMLLEAAGRNDVEEVRLLLESGVNPDVANEDGLTALHQCCIDDNEEMMKLLLDFGANVNAEDSEKWTPLHAAATCGHLHLVQYLIARSANLLSVNAEGNMPYDICDDETTLDYIESEMAKRGVTQELIEEIRALPETRMLQEMQRVHAQGGDLEVRDVDGATPLHIASANGYYRVAEFLLDNHTATDVQDKDFWQPIHAAACWGHLDVLELLVQNGADLDARTKNNETPYAICEDPEIKERIIQLRTEQQTKRQNEGRKRPSRTHSTNSRTQSIRRTSQRDKGLTSKRDAADEAQMLRAREELNKENSPSPTTDATGGTAASGANNTTSVVVNGSAVNGVAHPLNGDTHNNIQNGNTTSSEDDPEERMTYPPAMLGRDSVGNMKMKADEMNRLREIAVRSGAGNHNNQLNNQNVIHNGAPNNGVKMNNLLYSETNGSLMKNQTNLQKNLNNSSNNGTTVLSSPDDNGNLLPKPEINPSVDKIPLGGGLGSGVPLSGSRDNLVGLSNSAGNSTIDIHVSVTINTNSPVSTLTNGRGTGDGVTGHNGILPLSPGSSIFTPPGTLSDLKKQRSLIRTSSNPLTNGGLNESMTKYHPPASPTMSLRRYVGDPAETVGDYGDGGKRCCVIV